MSTGESPSAGRSVVHASVLRECMRIRHAHASLESVRHSMWRQRWGDASARVHSPRRWLLVCAAERYRWHGSWLLPAGRDTVVARTRVAAARAAPTAGRRQSEHSILLCWRSGRLHALRNFTGAICVRSCPQFSLLANNLLLLWGPK